MENLYLKMFRKEGNNTKEKRNDFNIFWIDENDDCRLQTYTNLYNDENDLMPE